MDILVLETMPPVRGIKISRGDIIAGDILSEEESSRLVGLGRAIPLDKLVKYIQEKIKPVPIKDLK